MPELSQLMVTIAIPLFIISIALNFLTMLSNNRIKKELNDIRNLMDLMARIQDNQIDRQQSGGEQGTVFHPQTLGE